MGGIGAECPRDMQQRLDFIGQNEGEEKPTYPRSPVPRAVQDRLSPTILGNRYLPAKVLREPFRLGLRTARYARLCKFPVARVIGFLHALAIPAKPPCGLCQVALALVHNLYDFALSGGQRGNPGRQRGAACSLGGKEAGAGHKVFPVVPRVLLSADDNFVIVQYPAH